VRNDLTQSEQQRCRQKSREVDRDIVGVAAGLSRRNWARNFSSWWEIPIRCRGVSEGECREYVVRDTQGFRYACFSLCDALQDEREEGRRIGAGKDGAKW
jgi:hypothetical protein